MVAGCRGRIRRRMAISSLVVSSVLGTKGPMATPLPSTTVRIRPRRTLWTARLRVPIRMGAQDLILELVATVVAWTQKTMTRTTRRWPPVPRRPREHGALHEYRAEKMCLERSEDLEVYTYLRLRPKQTTPKWFRKCIHQLSDLQWPKISPSVRLPLQQTSYAEGER